MPNTPYKYSTENDFIIKNKTTVIYALVAITFAILLGFLDFYILPNSKTADEITHYAVRTVRGKNGTKPQKVSYHYYTKKGSLFQQQRSTSKKMT